MPTSSLTDLNRDLLRTERARKADNNPEKVRFWCKREACRLTGQTVERRTKGHGTCTVCKGHNKL